MFKFFKKIVDISTKAWYYKRVAEIQQSKTTS